MDLLSVAAIDTEDDDGLDADDDTGDTSLQIFRLWTGMYISEFDEQSDDIGDGGALKLVSSMSKGASLDILSQGVAPYRGESRMSTTRWSVAFVYRVICLSGKR